MMKTVALLSIFYINLIYAKYDFNQRMGEVAESHGHIDLRDEETKNHFYRTENLLLEELYSKNLLASSVPKDGPYGFTLGVAFGIQYS